jgi:lipopolysaccharide biosynthesis glycosyltransferase
MLRWELVCFSLVLWLACNMSHIVNSQSTSTLEPIEIASIMVGSHYYTQVGPYISSLIQNNNVSINRIHLTLFTDNGGIIYLGPCLPKLRQKINIDLVDIFKFSIPPKMQQVAEMHPRWKNAFYKLILHDMYPTNVSHLLFIDVDTIVQEDLSSLWQYVYQPTYTLKVFFGVYVQENTYNGWPERGINTGMMLINLREMRNRNITFDTILAAYDKDLSVMPASGEQDFLNAWLSKHADDVVILPCKWNKTPDSRCPDFTDPVLKHVSGIAHGPNNAFKKHWDFPWKYRSSLAVLCGWQ